MGTETTCGKKRKRSDLTEDVKSVDDDGKRKRKTKA
jgi:hypothetical protein